MDGLSLWIFHPLSLLTNMRCKHSRFKSVMAPFRPIAGRWFFFLTNRDRPSHLFSVPHSATMTFLQPGLPLVVPPPPPIVYPSPCIPRRPERLSFSVNKAPPSLTKSPPQKITKKASFEERFSLFPAGDRILTIEILFPTEFRIRLFFLDLSQVNLDG